MNMIYEDGDAAAQCLSKIKSIVYTGKPMYIWWNNESSTTRQLFSPKHLDELKSRELLKSVYQKYCPEMVNKIKISFITTAARILKKSSGGGKEYYTLRKELYGEIGKYIKNHKDLPYTKKDRIYVVLFKIGLPTFDFVMSLWIIIKH